MDIRIGTSGFSYRWWWGRFYPREVKPGGWLEYYAQHFNTVELNATFYRLPEPERFIEWAARAPENFLFAVKASRIITHIRRLWDCAEPLKNFFDAVIHLGEKLGPVLYQLPPNLKADLTRLRAFLKELPEGFTHVFEFRHESWFAREVFDLLEEHGCVFCVHDHGGMNVPHVTTADVTYWRFHGTGMRGECYGREQLLTPAQELAALAGEGKRVFAYFNNDAAACAVTDARELRALIEKAIARNEQDESESVDK